MKSNKNIYLILLLSTLSFESLSAINQRLFGITGHYSLMSSYYSIESAAIEKKDKTSYSNGIGGGLFFDYKYSPYASVKTHFAFFPHWKKEDSVMQYDVDEIMIEAGILSLTLFNSAPYNFWVGYGPAFQYSTSDGLKNYIVSFYVASGCNYFIKHGLYLVPEVYLGANMYLKNKEYENMVKNVTETTDFLNNGFTISIKLGIAYAI
ncbi:MAG: hypothetical protein OEZ22_01310 [Spirochaetia bacterium]|nr:hypothetical protein [Spirochaetia bacterium]